MRQRKPAVPHESLIQRAFVKFCRSHPDRRINKTHSVKNSGKKAPISYGRDIAEGLLKGVPDLFIPYPTGKQHGLYLEFKGPKGKQTPEQRDYELFCTEYGYGYVVVRSVDQAIRALFNYINMHGQG